MKQLLQNYAEFEELSKAFQNEMPYINENLVKVPYKFAPFPKNLMDESVKVNEKFLDNWWSVIQDKLPQPYLDLFLIYQNKYFSKHRESQNLKESLFRKCNCKTRQQIRDKIIQSMSIKRLGIGEPILDHLDFLGNIFMGNHGNAFISFGGCTQQSELTTGGTASSGGGFNGAIIVMTATGTIDNCADQIALNLDGVAGNERLGCYDDSGSDDPENLLAETGSITSVTGFNFQSVTEFNLDTAKVWFGFQIDNVANEVFFTGGGKRNEKTQAFGAFEDPNTGTTSTSVSEVNCKMGHS